MSVKLLTEHDLKFLSLIEAAQAGLSLHLSKCHIVGNHMSQLICILTADLASKYIFNFDQNSVSVCYLLN